MAKETIAGQIAHTLVEREWKLGTVECGVAGIVSHHIFDTEEGVNALGNSLVLDDVGDAIGLMDLPRPQFKKQGDFSAKAARAAAREGRAFLGVHICLAVWAQGPVTEEKEQLAHLAVHNGRDVFDDTVQVGGNTGNDSDWLVNRALEMIQQALE